MKLLDKIFGESDKNYKFKTTVFFICLSASSIIWLFSKLSESYTSQIVIPIKTENVPQGKILIGKSDSILNLSINDSGFALLWIKYFNRKRTFQIDLNSAILTPIELVYDARVSTRQWSDDFLEQFNLAGRIASIKPDTVVFKFEERMHKKVPVIADVSLNFRRQFFGYDTLKILPDSVVISGLERYIMNVDHIKTKQLVYNDVHSSINTSEELQIPNFVKLEDLPSRRVNLMLSVEKFTEARILIPITTINTPQNMRVRIFPEEASVSYFVAVKDYRLIAPDMFRLQVDLSVINNQVVKKLEVTPVSFPLAVIINRIEPREVEYLILK